MVILIFVFFVLYTLACIADGPDVKPLWKRWLGLKLERWADSLKPINYCRGTFCKCYQTAQLAEEYKHRYEVVLEEIYKINALNTRPTMIISNYDIKQIEEAFIIGESELSEAYIYEEMAKRHGYPPYMMFKSVDRMVEEVKFKCIGKVLDIAKSYVRIDVDRESHYPEIIVRGSLLVGVKKNEERT